MKNNITKKEQLKSFKENISAIFKLTCVICEKEFEYELDQFDGDPSEIKDFVKSAYAKGWRQSESKIHDQIGIHCPECHKYRNSAKYFKY